MNKKNILHALTSYRKLFFGFLIGTSICFVLGVKPVMANVLFETAPLATSTELSQLDTHFTSVGNNTICVDTSGYLYICDPNGSGTGAYALGWTGPLKFTFSVGSAGGQGFVIYAAGQPIFYFNQSDFFYIDHGNYVWQWSYTNSDKITVDSNLNGDFKTHVSQNGVEMNVFDTSSVFDSTTNWIVGFNAFSYPDLTYLKIEDYNSPITPTPTLSPTTTPTPSTTPVPNQAPLLSPLSSVTINEGQAYTASGTFSDTDSQSWTATVDYGDGSGVQPLTLAGFNFGLNHIYKDAGVFNLTVKITDNQGGVGIGTSLISVQDIPFTVSAISISSAPISVNTSVPASVTFTDPGIYDTHTAIWNWGDGATSSGTVVESNGTGTVKNSHIYPNAGVYTVTATVMDEDGVKITSTFQYIVVFDPTAGFLTAGGQYLANAGWDIQNTTAAGKVSIGISAKYKSDNPTPKGEFEMNFSNGKLDFESSSYNWLVISGAKATLQGTGSINDKGSCNFIVSVIDGKQTGGQDLIRVKITNLSNTVVFDTQPGTDQNADPTTPLNHGNIKIH